MVSDRPGNLRISHSLINILIAIPEIVGGRCGERAIRLVPLSGG